MLRVLCVFLFYFNIIKLSKTHLLAPPKMHFGVLWLLVFFTLNLCKCTLRKTLTLKYTVVAPSSLPRNRTTHLPLTGISKVCPINSPIIAPARRSVMPEESVPIHHNDTVLGGTCSCKRRLTTRHEIRTQLNACYNLDLIFAYKMFNQIVITGCSTDDHISLVT